MPSLISGSHPPRGNRAGSYIIGLRPSPEVPARWTEAGWAQTDGKSCWPAEWMTTAWPAKLRSVWAEVQSGGGAPSPALISLSVMSAAIRDVALLEPLRAQCNKKHFFWEKNIFTGLQVRTAHVKAASMLLLTGARQEARRLTQSSQSRSGSERFQHFLESTGRSYDIRSTKGIYNCETSICWVVDTCLQFVKIWN